MSLTESATLGCGGVARFGFIYLFSFYYALDWQRRFILSLFNSLIIT
jgi:hypothetical protein